MGGSDRALVLGLIAFLVVARGALAIPGRALRDWAFALVNLAAIGAIAYAKPGPWLGFFAAYLAVVVVSWGAMRALARRRGRAPWLAFAIPLFALGLVKYASPAWRPLFHALGTPEPLQIPGLYFVGLSYMAFRLSYLVLEVRNGVVEPPGLGRYLGFAFFFPTVFVGPISRFATHEQSLDRPSRRATPVVTSLLRLVVGLTKYLFLGNLANQVAYASLQTDAVPHARVDWVIAAIAYYLYLYLNFSGFCDVAIGAAGLLGIRVDENFDQPFRSRNIQDYWNRWHITLSTYLRDVVFTPLSKVLVGRLGPKNRDHAVAIAVFVTFVLVGVWHGAGFNFVAFGLLHAIAVVAHHYYAAFLKKRLGKAGIRAYNENRWIRAVAVLSTHVYVTLALGFFAAKGDGLLRLLHLVK